MTLSRPPQSPRVCADAAKRSRDLEGEVLALTGAASALDQAPWQPLRAGDVITVHYERTSHIAAFFETYQVTAHPDGPSTGLTFTGCTPDTEDNRSLSGYFAPGVPGDPMSEMWMEAGPGRLTVTRGEEVLHNGPESWR